MMAFNCIWLVFLGLYLEQVMPKTFGRRAHPCFCFKASFWGCSARKNKTKIGVADPAGAN